MAVAMSAGSDQGGSDLGRRVRDYRHHAGLSLEDAAGRAGMAAGYLRYVETSPAPSLTPSALARLAGALETSASALAGAGLERAPGRGRALDRPVLEPLTAAQCREYLGTAGVGRFLLVESRGPVAIPVNYAMIGDDVVVRTSERTSVARAGGSQVSFEVDHLDEALAEGWSVLVSGDARVVTAAAELAAVRSLGIAPWAGGDRETYVRITASDMTGRRIRASVPEH